MTPDADDQDRLRSLAEMARALGRSRGLAGLIELAAEGALAALAAASVSVSRLEPGEGVLRVLVNVGDLAPGEQRHPADETYRVEDYEQLSGVVEELRAWTAAIGDAASDPGEIELLRSLGKGSALAAPLLVDGVVWGELYATRHVGAPRFAEGHIAYTEALAAIMAGAISRAIREEVLHRLAYTDPLTGLPNRRAFDEAAGRAAAPPATGAPVRPVSVVVADVNGLKAVNDSLGHAEGDAVLRAVADLLLRHFGPFTGGLVARLGGDEFGVVVSGNRAERVLAAAREVSAAAAALPHGVGIACGVASGPSGVPVRDLVRAADAAQYRAKALGGSAVVQAGTDGVPGLPGARDGHGASPAAFP